MRAIHKFWFFKNLRRYGQTIIYKIWLKSNLALVFGVKALQLRHTTDRHHLKTNKQTKTLFTLNAPQNGHIRKTIDNYVFPWLTFYILQRENIVILKITVTIFISFYTEIFVWTGKNCLVIQRPRINNQKQEITSKAETSS